MSGRLKSAAACGASALTLTLLLFAWAAARIRGAAHFRDYGSRSTGRAEHLAANSKPPRQSSRGETIPSPVSFRESGSRGLLVNTWVNGAGPFTFAVDTGAGATILSPRVAGAARVEVEDGRGIEVGGLSGASAGGGQKAFPREIALGSRENILPARGLAIVAPGLPANVDGILDP